MIYTETIELIDKVSPAAKRAAKNVDALIASVKSLKESLDGVGGLPSAGGSLPSKTSGGPGRSPSATKPASSGPLGAPAREADKEKKKSLADTAKAERTAASASAKLEKKSLADTAKAERTAASEAAKGEKKSLADTAKAERTAASASAKLEKKSLADTAKAERTAAGEAAKVKKKSLADTAKAERTAASDGIKLEKKSLAEKSKAEKLISKEAVSGPKNDPARRANDALKAEKKSLSDVAQAKRKAIADDDKLQSKAVADATAKAAKLTAAIALGKEVIGGAVAGFGAALSSLGKGDAQGVIGGVTDSLASAAQLLDLVVPGLGQAASLLIKIAGGFVGMAAGLVQAGAAFAIESAQSKDAMISMLDALGQGVTSGAQFDDMLSGMSQKLGVTKDAMVPLVREFASMGIVGEDAVSKLTTAALSAKALAGGADSGAQAFTALAKKIQLAGDTGLALKIPLKGLGSLSEMGLSLPDVADVMGLSESTLADQLTNGTVSATKLGNALQDALIKKGAGPLKTMGRSMANMKAMLSQSIGDVFEDIKIGPFIDQVKDLFSIFAAGTPVGDMLKAGIGGFFDEFFSLMTLLVPFVKEFFLDLVILSLRTYIALTPMVSKIKEFFATKEGATLLSTSLDGIEKILKAIGYSVLIVAGAFTAVWGAMILVSAAFWSTLGAMIGFYTAAQKAIYDWVLGATTSAKNFVLGLVNGILSGGALVADAVTSLASKATKAFSSAMSMRSPSKVMFKLGGYVSEGVAEGIDAGAPAVGGASRGLATASVQGFEGGATAPSASASKAGASVTVNVQIDGAGKSALEITEQMVASVFERMALGAGL